MSVTDARSWCAANSARRTTTGTRLMPVAQVSGDVNQYARAGPICGARTGLAIPKKITTP